MSFRPDLAFSQSLTVFRVFLGWSSFYNKVKQKPDLLIGSKLQKNWRLLNITLKQVFSGPALLIFGSRFFCGVRRVSSFLPGGQQHSSVPSLQHMLVHSIPSVMTKEGLLWETQLRPWGQHHSEVILTTRNITIKILFEKNECKNLKRFEPIVIQSFPCEILILQS